MGDVRDPERDQVAPTPNEKRPIQDMVIEDILERKEHGIRKYGTPVQAGNGRDMLLDAYEETMDLVIYLRGALEEGKEFSISSQPVGEYRVVSSDGQVQKNYSSRFFSDIYMTLRPGDRLEERYRTYTERFEWRSELSPNTQEKIKEFEDREATYRQKRS